ANLVLLIDIGNTYTHLGLANRQRVLKHSNIPTVRWFNGSSEIAVKKFVGSASPAGACLCGVVPGATPLVRRAVKRLWNISPVELTPQAVHGYRGLVRELITELKRELKVRQLPVVATGGYARLLVSKMPEIKAVDPLLTLEGLRLVAQASCRQVPRRPRRA